MSVIDYPTILQQINTNINDNTNREITPADVRGVLIALLNNDKAIETALTIPTPQTVDLTAYYTKTESDSRFAPIGSGTGTGSTVDLTAYYTKTESDSKFALKTSIPAIPDLTVFYTKTESDNKFALKTSIPDVSNFITASSIPDVSHFLTSSQVDTIIGARNFVDSTQLSTALATKQNTNAALTEFINSHDAVITAQTTDKWLHLDGSGHLVFEDLPTGTGTGSGTSTAVDLTPYLKKDGSVVLNPNYVPSVNQGIATKKYVDDSRPDLTPYLESSTASATYALKSEIPSLTGYVTSSALSTALQPYALTSALPTAPDLTVFYTKTESDAKYALASAIPDITVFYTKTESDGKFALKTSIPDVSGFLTSAGLTAALQPYALTSALPDLTSYYTKTESDGKFALKTAIPTIPDLSSYVTSSALTTALQPYALTSALPDLSTYATTAALATGLAGKQATGDYALRSELPSIAGLLKADGSIPLADAYTPANPHDIATFGSIEVELRKKLRGVRESYKARVHSEGLTIAVSADLNSTDHGGLYLACQGDITLTIPSSVNWQEWEEIGVYSESGNVTLHCGGVTKINGATTDIVIKALDYRVLKMHRPNEWYCVA